MSTLARHTDWIDERLSGLGLSTEQVEAIRTVLTPRDRPAPGEGRNLPPEWVEAMDRCQALGVDPYLLLGLFGEQAERLAKGGA